jgi:hypothetical protein
MISSWVTESAPWRFEVPMQSEPVSPPPITTTCLPLAASDAARCRAVSSSPATRLFCCGQEFHGEVNAGELAARDLAGRAALSAPPARTTASKSVEQLRRPSMVDADLDAGAERRRPRPPSARTRRSIRCFSILKSGMP